MNTERNDSVVVIGGSAGALEALLTLVAGLPADFPAAVFVVIHFPSTGASRLAEILGRVASLPVRIAVDGEQITPGVILTAPPNRHMVLQKGFVYLTEDAKEHNFRPAVDPLLRSAALSYGKSAIAVVLSGLLDDGTSGAIAIKKRGGQVLVQCPEDALFPSMPESVLASTKVDASVPASQLADTLSQCVRMVVSSGEVQPKKDSGTELREPTGRPDGGLAGQPFPPGRSTPLTCPSCHGTLWEAEESSNFRLYQCHTGHRFSARTLATEQSLSLEKSLQEAHRAAKERAFLSRSLAETAANRDNDELAVMFAARAESETQQATFILAAIHASPFHEKAEAVGTGEEPILDTEA